MDTIEIEIPRENISINQDLFDGNLKYEPLTKKVKNNYLVANNKALGIERITVNKSVAKIKTSAKLLKENYWKNISFNTLENFQHNLTKSNLIQTDMDSLLDAEIYKAHFVTNLELDKKQALKSLKLGTSNNAFNYLPYQSCKNAGMMFLNKAKTVKKKISYYDKSLELQTSANKQFIRQISKPIELLSKFENTLRVEREINQKPMLRKSLAAKPKVLTFEQVLGDEAKPILELHSEVMKFAEQITLFDDYANMSYGEAMKEIGYLGLYYQSNESIETALHFVESFQEKEEVSRATIWRRKKKVKKEFAKIENKKSPKTSQYLETLQQINELLRA